MPCHIPTMLASHLSRTEGVVHGIHYTRYNKKGISLPCNTCAYISCSYECSWVFGCQAWYDVQVSSITTVCVLQVEWANESAPVVFLGSCELVSDVDWLDVLLVLPKHLNSVLVEDGIGGLGALWVDQEGGGKAKGLSLLWLGTVLDLHKAHTYRMRRTGTEFTVWKHLQIKYSGMNSSLHQSLRESE